MTETFPISQWEDAADKSIRGAMVTGALHPNEILRWRERIPQSSSGGVLGSAGAETVNPIFEKTTGQIQAEVHVPRAKKAGGTERTNYILLKKFEGFVLSRDKETFTARLYENRSDYPVLEAEFDLEELSEADRQLVVEGAALVWTIGYHDVDSRKRESVIYMRRLPGWSKREAEQAKKETDELVREIQWR